MMETLRAFFRLVAFGLFSLFIMAIFCAGLPFCKLLGKSRTGWKNGLISCWAGGIARIMGLTINIEGTVPEPPFFLISNHLSYLDILPFWKHLKTTFVAKNEIQQWPFFGFAARMLGIIFIDRSNRRDVSRVNKLISQNINWQQGVIVFPEGTSSKGKKVLPFKSSLFFIPARMAIPVHFASISYSISSEGHHQAWKEICWWGDMDFFPHFWNVLKIKCFRVKVVFGSAPIKNEDRKTLALTLHQAVKNNFMTTFKQQ